jgi:hypothetical protein
MPNGIQLEIDGGNRVATTKSPMDKLIKQASKNRKLAIMIMIPRANLNECSYSFHAGVRMASLIKNVKFPNAEALGNWGNPSQLNIFEDST